MPRHNNLVVVLALTATACTGLQPVELEPEYARTPSAAPHWDTLQQTTPERWLHLLNDGPAALDWRLRAIDSATDSIDLQTFLWHFDTTGSLVLDHLVRAADRGVRVRILVDDTFLLGEDNLLEALHELPSPDVDEWRRENIRLQARRELRRAGPSRWRRGYDRIVEPISVALVSGGWLLWAAQRVLLLQGG